ncbi:MAG: tetratricopeptide repeat protein [Candidatus Sumerlaeia bacterium]|nr:tetratricopeptide repeat protein [Candidatus Sumerlaeia bacterium]
MSRFQKLERHPGAPAEAPVAAPSQPAEAEQESQYGSLLAQADDAYFGGDPRGALRLYSRALQADSTQLAPWSGQVNALLAMKQYREGDVWSNRALEQFPEEPTLLSQRARVVAYVGDTKRAMGISDYAMSRGGSPLAWLGRGEVLLLANNANATFCFDKALELAGPEDWRTPLEAGMVCFRLRKFSAAADYLGKAAQRNLRHYHTWQLYAKALAELNFTERAREAARHAKEIAPKEQRRTGELEEDVVSRTFWQRIAGFLRR